MTQSHTYVFGSVVLDHLISIMGNHQFSSGVHYVMARAITSPTRHIIDLLSLTYIPFLFTKN